MPATVMNTIIRWLEKPYRFEILDKYLRGASARVLDVGCGNHSASRTKKYYPSCKYYGVDVTRYNNDEPDFQCMEQYFEMNIDEPQNPAALPDVFFDVIIFSHVIEHTRNGPAILETLARKLKSGGVIYVETPTSTSTRLPSMPGTLNFYDDPTHLCVYKLQDISAVLEKNGCAIVRMGMRRSTKRILLLPVYLIGSLVRFREVRGVVFWDLLGFANYLLARKK